MGSGHAQRTKRVDVMSSKFDSRSPGARRLVIILSGLMTGLIGLATLLAGCTVDGNEVDLAGRDVRLTILHTSDWHSRLLPYDLDVGLTDEGLGLDPDKGPFGGVARLAYLIERERANAGRSIYVDSGDCFQGAPIFNAFEGEVDRRRVG